MSRTPFACGLARCSSELVRSHTPLHVSAYIYPTSLPMDPYPERHNQITELCAVPGVHLDKNGHIQTHRNLPIDGPLDPVLVPDKIKHLFDAYQKQGFVNAPPRKLYEAKKLLRRYALISRTSDRRIKENRMPPAPKTKPSKATLLQRRNEYKRRWRLQRKIHGFATL